MQYFTRLLLPSLFILTLITLATGCGKPGASDEPTRLSSHRHIPSQHRAVLFPCLFNVLLLHPRYLSVMLGAGLSLSQLSSFWVPPQTS